MKNLSLLCFCFLFLSAQAKTIEGISFEDKVSINGKSLVLNGIGRRLATFLNIKVYLGALYLEKTSSDAQKVMNSNELKYIQMHFQRDLSKDKFENGIKEGFEKNKTDYSKYENDLKSLFSNIPELKKHDIISLLFSANGLTISHGSKKLDVNNPAFAKEILKIFLGNPPNKELKTGMLGQ